MSEFFLCDTQCRERERLEAANRALRSALDQSEADCRALRGEVERLGAKLGLSNQKVHDLSRQVQEWKDWLAGMCV